MEIQIRWIIRIIVIAVLVTLISLLLVNKFNKKETRDTIETMDQEIETIVPDKKESQEEITENEEMMLVPTKEEVLEMRKEVLEGMSEEEIDRLKENIKLLNLELERKQLNENLFSKLSDPENLYWNYIDHKEYIQIGWKLKDGDRFIASKTELTQKEYLEKYGEEIIEYNRLAADDYIQIFTELHESIHHEVLKQDFQKIILSFEKAKETHDVVFIEDIYKIVHDMDYFLFRYGIEDMRTFVDDMSTVSIYYGVLAVYEDELADK